MAAFYRYNCTEGHYIESNGRVVTCPVYVHGSPCKGTLTSKGKKERVVDAPNESDASSRIEGLLLDGSAALATNR